MNTRLQARLGSILLTGFILTSWSWRSWCADNQRQSSRRWPTDHQFDSHPLGCERRARRNSWVRPAPEPMVALRSIQRVGPSGASLYLIARGASPKPMRKVATIRPLR